MRVGMCFPYEVESSAGLDLARAADAQGLDSIWVVENAYWPGAFATAGALAAVTERLTIGIGVVSPFTRSPAVIAMEAAQVQQLSRGRLVFGLGASTPEVLADMGIPASGLFGGMSEALELMPRLFGDGVDSFKGTRFELTNIRLSFSVTPPPIVVGSVGAKMLALAGERADGIIISTHCPTSFIEQCIITAREGATIAGRDADGLSVTAFVVTALDRDAAEARRALKPSLAWAIARFAGKPSLERILVSAGIDLDHIQSISEGFREGRDPSRLVDDWIVDALCVAGDADVLAERLETLRAIGVNEVVLFDAPNAPGFVDFIPTVVAAASAI